MPFPVSEEDISAAEAALGVALPAAYRQRMMRANGGTVAVGTDAFDLFKVLDRTNRKRLARTSAVSIVRENEQAKEWQGYPPEAVAFAQNATGDYLVWIRDGDHLASEVFMWDHETGRLHLVAGGFEELSDA